MSAFAPTISSPETSVGFGEGAGTAPSTGLGFLKETFGSIKKSLGRMVGLQERDTKIQEKQLDKLEFLDDGAQGPVMPKAASGEEALEGVDTDDKTYSNFVAKAEEKGSAILDGIKEAFGNVSFGEKMMAIVLAGGFFIFSKYKDQLVKVLTPVVQFVMDIVDFLGPEGAFMAFIGGFILLKSGLAKKAIMFAGKKILSGIKATAAYLDEKGGFLKVMNNAYRKMNIVMRRKLIPAIGRMGAMISGGLTKGFTMLGNGLKALRIGIVSMSSSLGAMLTPFLPAIAIAAAAVAIFYSLKSGFDTFKQSLEDGDSMFTAVIKGLGDAMLTLVTLPYVLVQKLVGFIAGLFGFDNFKAKLEEFDIKEAIVNTFKRLTGGMVMMIKAIAKGAAAALAAALPGGTTPQEAFAKTYAEVMAGGNADTSSNLEGTTDYQGSGEDASIEKANEVYDKKGFNKMDTSEMGGDLIGGDEGQGTGNAVAVSYYKKQAEEQRYRDLGEGTRDFDTLTFDQYAKLNNITQGAEGSDDFGGAVYDADGNKVDYMAEMLKTYKGTTTLSTKATLKGEDGRLISEKGQTITIVKGGTVTGDTVNQMSQTNVTGPLEVNNTEVTQKILQEHTF